MTTVMKSLKDGLFGGGDAAGKAAELQAGASQAAINEQRRQFNLTQENFKPFLESGQSAVKRFSDLIGISGPEAQAAAISQFQDSPGQKFIVDEALQDVVRNASAIGGLASGNTKQALVDRATNLASTNFQNQLNNISSLIGVGTNTASNQANIGQNTASNIGNFLINQGEARASGVLGRQQANAQLFNQGVGLASYLASDENLKADIKNVTAKECYDALMSIDIKQWRYKGDGKTHLGPMAQDAPDMIVDRDALTLSLHDELMMITGALQYVFGKIDGEPQNGA